MKGGAIPQGSRMVFSQPRGARMRGPAAAGAQMTRYVLGSMRNQEKNMSFRVSGHELMVLTASIGNGCYFVGLGIPETDRRLYNGYTEQELEIELFVSLAWELRTADHVFVVSPRRSRCLMNALANVESAEAILEPGNIPRYAERKKATIAALTSIASLRFAVTVLGMPATVLRVADSSAVLCSVEDGIALGPLKNKGAIASAADRLCMPTSEDEGLAGYSWALSTLDRCAQWSAELLAAA